jgi:hypothetical protein
MTSTKAPELTPSAQKIDRLIQRIDQGDIRIPAFQRGYVWKQNQVIELLESIVANYPIGSILMWNTKERLKFTRNIGGYVIPETKLEYPLNYVLDGQQRLSSIYGVFSESATQDSTSQQYNPNPNIFEIAYDFERNIFSPSVDIDATKKSSILLRNLLGTTRLIAALKDLDSKYHDSAGELASSFLNYEIPVVTLTHRTKEEVGIIFERINSTGTRLTTVDLMTAWTWTDDFHLLEATNELSEELEKKGFGDVSYNLIIQAVSGIILGDTSTQAIVTLSGEQVRDNWDVFCEALKKAIDFLSTDLNCKNSVFLPHVQQLVSLTAFFSVAGPATADQLAALRKWFWKTAFSNRYSTGQTRKKMNNDIETVMEFRSSNFANLSTYSYTVTKNELHGTKFSKGNSLTRALLLLFAQSAPVDLVKNSAVDLAGALSSYNRKEYHHVFPQSFLKGLGLKIEKINCVLNFCFLPADSNKKISSKKPSDYVFNLIPASNRKDILMSNTLPVDPAVYQNDDYDSFMAKRADIIISKLDDLTT